MFEEAPSSCNYGQSVARCPQLLEALPAKIAVG